MTNDEFWAVIEYAAGAGGPESIDEALSARLEALGPDAIGAFAKHWDERMDAAYDWRVWAAAYVMDGGCSDDGFMDFRSSAILLGRDRFERLVRDPDALGEIADEMGASEWDFFYESYAYAIQRAWEATMGEAPLPERATPHPSEPSGVPWDEADVATVVPRTSARFPGE